MENSGNAMVMATGEGVAAFEKYRAIWEAFLKPAFEAWTAGMNKDPTAPTRAHGFGLEERAVRLLNER